MSAALAPVAGASEQDPLPDPRLAERCFRLDAEADPGLLLRCLGLFAKLNLVPRKVAAEYQGGRLRAEIRVNGLSDGQSDHIAQVMRGLFGVEWVILS